MNRSFIEDIMHSGMIHRPLRLDESKSFEHYHGNAQILEEIVLFSKEVRNYEFKHQGCGECYTDEAGMLHLSSSQIYDHWPKGAPADGDYTNYGVVTASCALPRLDLSTYNRLSFEIKPNCPGMVNPHIMVSLKNDGVIKVPDIYNREGYHTANLKNNQWQTCFLEISDLARDAMTEIAFSVLINGQDRATVNHMHFEIRRVAIQKAASSSISKGWMPARHELVYSHNGYNISSPKLAILNDSGSLAFQLIDAKQHICVYENKTKEIKTSVGQFQMLDFSDFQEKGRYYLSVNDIRTEDFFIDDYPARWHDSIYRSLNFIFCERCGCPVTGLHGSCHEDVIATHRGQTIIFNGGWHDAGDVSQQLVQSAEVTEALYGMAETVKHQDLPLYLRLMEEAEWGLDFIFKTRFQDGYRATSAGVTRWSDCRIGNMDDSYARVHNNAYENFFLAGIEARIARMMDQEDRLLARTREIAIEDFAFALAVFEKDGFKHEPVFWEHTYNMSESLFLATMVQSACALYQLTGRDAYAKYAQQWVARLIACQEQTGIRLFDGQILKGFFYRSHAHRVVQHFNHQAREHIYAKALSALIESNVCPSENDAYRQCLKDYGDYLKYLMQFTYPYPMIASGVYRDDECNDQESFSRQHLLTGEEAIQDFSKQLAASCQVAEHFYVRRFPVWFSFRGNNAILLSMAKSASVIGRCLDDQDLMDTAEGQLQWMVGMNPFGQSLVYGEGHHYASLYSVLTGEMTGAMPVGIQTFENEDEPYWPQLNNATYKEVWVGLAGKWMEILIDLYKG